MHATDQAKHGLDVDLRGVRDGNEMVLERACYERLKLELF